MKLLHEESQHAVSKSANKRIRSDTGYIQTVKMERPHHKRAFRTRDENQSCTRRVQMDFQASTNRENGLSGTWTWTTSNDLCHSFIFTSRRLRICRQLRHLRIDAPGASTKVWGFRGFGSLSFKSMRTWLWKWHHHTTRFFLASLIRMPVITLLMKSNYPAMSQGLED